MAMPPTLDELLLRHQRDAEDAGVYWLAAVVALVRQDAAAIPAPVKETATLPEYVYPH